MERPYTISHVPEGDNELTITIKRDRLGLFTNWLYNQSAASFTVNISQPQGRFLLNEDESIPALCFAGGIGVTPFITFASWLERNQSQKKMHLIYTALKESDFIAKDVFKEISAKKPDFTVNYRTTEEDGYLTESEISAANQSNPDAEIYICGPKPFLNLLNDIFNKLNIPRDKIYEEEFVHAGQSPATQ